ncbi:4-hydroxybenzoyl-CoA reductase [Zhengella mangrovi]|uniref:4-hydroxybenzoyl-CoA reductase n=1 Tax=Zhengella mangrovi TaxID=1982044 RepID=A0A2G1QGZ2_9HYPH|nr:xanthine dehydrogenase family protein subunit M [Zhengella mangrovi]PHP64786.1 4-hydroxybenzoyl-CoA reductase [Zhengella mangrovi]
MRPFDFLEPSSLPEALSMLAEHGDACCIMAGGTALLLAMRQRMLAPETVVSLGKLDELRDIAFDPDAGLRIGALARHADVAGSSIVQAHCPALAGMAGGLANPQVRNQGTIGGNLCYADPATDPATFLLAAGAEVTIAGRGGERRLPLRAFLVDYFTTALESGEILTAIHLPPPGSRQMLYRRYLRTPAEHRPVVNIALSAVTDGGALSDVRLIVGAATPVPQALAQTEDFLAGKSVNAAIAAEAAALAGAEVEPLSDGRADAAFRRQIVRTATRRILLDAAGLDWKDNAA